MLCVQDFTVQLLETLEFLHGIRMIHTDLKIENVLLMNDREVTYRNQRVPASTKIKIIDFGGACYDSDKKSAVINTRQYRAPEVILGTGWSMPSDMWSLGCILAELYSGELLFATHDDVEHLALIEKKIGLFPRRMINASKDGQDPELARSAFDSTGLHRLGRVLTSEHYSFVRKALPLESHIKSDDDWFLDLLRRILVIDPHERATAHEALQYLRRIRRDVVRCT
ncbi:CDC-like kinase [Fistulifera solaris]|uniref:CDC-like kinase n=1 Tax=Fistulifera solaris TaxID=1519565 RepID=A0A1Z5JM69_FISSO|nr:CDC-like kinase [Fistulifera solaris]|eukprot:GAX15006.1 CDC-like kinase [Fistulifera solaris]